MPAGAPAFVAAKIATPSVGRALIRPDVLARIAAGASKRLLIVRAPAGYGKTAVIAEAARRLAWRAAWYRIDVLDHDPAVFVASLVQAVRDRVPGFGAILIERFAEAHETPMSPAEMVALLVSELRDEVDDELHIIVDDYHQAIASAELNRTLDYVLANLPPLVHLVLLTRFQPTVSTTRLKLDDALAEVSFEDLRLEPSQVVELFADRSSARLQHDQAVRLVEITEGWPASLVLISRARDWTSLGSIENALVDPRLTSDVFSYLSEEAFRREDAETVAFLLATCCLESMTIELADTVARSDHARRSLERLVAHNVFTFVDRATGTYRYHQLLRDYLQQWYANEYGAEAFRSQQLHTAASVEDAGDPETAIELYFAANEPERALGMVSRSGELVTDNCRFSALRSWLERLAPNTSLDDPWVLFLAGQLALREGDSSQALAALTRAEAQLRARNDQWGVYHALSAIEAIWFWKGDFERSATYCQAALEAATTTEQRVHTLVSLGSAQSYMCHWGEADLLWKEAESLRPGLCPRERARVAALRANMDYLCGRFLNAHAGLTRVIPFVETSGFGPLKVTLIGVLADLLRDLGRYTEAAAAGRFCIDECEALGLDHLRHMFDEGLARVSAANGDFDSARQVFERLAKSSRIAQDAWSLSTTLCGLADTLRRAGLLHEATDAYRAAIDSGRRTQAPTPLLSAEAGLVFSQALLHGGGRDALRQLQRKCQRLDLAFIANTCAFFSAVLAFRAGEQNGAMASLKRCLPTQLRLGHIDFLCQEFATWPDLGLEAAHDSGLAEWRSPLVAALTRSRRSTPLLVGMLDSGDGDLISLILECEGAVPEPVIQELLSWARRHGRIRDLRAIRKALPHHPSASVTQLTSREEQVLGLIAAGHRNPEVARRLFLSEKTVKTHINHIFTKLGVSDRVQAVLYYRAYIQPLAGQDTTRD